jgi:hypothetical protein
VALSELQRVGTALRVSLRQRLAELRAHEYPTDSANVLAATLESLVGAVGDSLRDTSDYLPAQFCCQALRELGDALAFLEGAHSTVVPGSLIQPIESLVRSIFPSANILLRVQWTYNYQVFDIAGWLNSLCKSLIGEERVTDLLKPLDNFFVVSVPTIERSNILLHTILGHELGHRIASQFIENEQEQLMQDVELQVGDLSWWESTIDSDQQRFRVRQYVMEEMIVARKRALEELISDIVGQQLFGLSALLATSSFAKSDTLDALPESDGDYYPPWRYRLRCLYRRLDEGGEISAVTNLTGPDATTKVRGATVRELESIKQLVDEETDLAVIESDAIVARAYRDLGDVLERARSFAQERVGDARFSVDQFSGEISPLIERLALGVPPDSLGTQRPDFRSAIAAGWLYHLARICVPFVPGTAWSDEHDDILARLVAKGMESIQLQTDFSHWRAAQE